MNACSTLLTRFLPAAVAKALGKPFKFLGYAGRSAMPPATRCAHRACPATSNSVRCCPRAPESWRRNCRCAARSKDKLPPFSIEQAKAEVEKELGSRSVRFL